ncbi:MAG: HAD-IIIA family hydrolase [Prevotellaceae bacterium]|nr:HAD-IIIA family hydrolase [Prevotellaceae bacterium]
MKQFDNYIFDLDGTLLSTLGDLTTSTNYAMRAFNMPEHSIDEVRKFVGNGIRKLIERAIPQGIENPQYEQVYNVFMEHYLKHSLDTTKPYDGIMDMLKTLKGNGKRMAIVSNKYCTATEELCQHFFNEYINVAIGESERIKKKPAPDTVIEAMERLGITRENTVYVGDSEVDIATARNSGIPCISVLWGFREKDFLIENGGKTFIEHPRQLTEW